MGGNALKTAKTRRYNRDEFFDTWAKIYRIFVNQGTICRGIELIPAYETKESFGDMDILIDEYEFSKSKFTNEFIKEKFGSTEIVRNGVVISFNFEEIQVDLIFTKTFDYSLCYFSYNDLGNLIGRLAHKFGLKHGHDGLSLPIRDDSHVYRTYSITTDHDETLRFLNLDVDTYKRGFKTLEDIFLYVSSSKYFRPEIYLFENLNNIQRTRDRKRSTYNAFLEWCKTREFSEKKWYTSKTDALNYAIEYFDNEHGGTLFRDAYEKTFQEIAARKYISSKFNGEIVMNVTNLTGKNLGEFMKHLKTNTPFKYDSFVMSKTDEQIKDHIRYEFLKGA